MLKNYIVSLIIPYYRSKKITSTIKSKTVEMLKSFYSFSLKENSCSFFEVWW